MYNAMDKLLKAASKMKTGGEAPKPPSEEELKPEIAAAKGVLDAAAQGK